MSNKTIIAIFSLLLFSQLSHAGAEYIEGTDILYPPVNGLPSNDHPVEKDARVSSLVESQKNKTTTTSPSDSLQIVLPESPTNVVLSNEDMNRLKCESGDMNDLLFSEEKGITTLLSGKNAYIKYFITERDGFNGKNQTHVTQRTEFYAVCNGQVYTIFSEPKNVPAQTILLSSGKSNSISKNIANFKGMELEQRIIELTHHAIKNEIPSSYTVKKINGNSPITLSYSSKTLYITPLRRIDVDGIGLSVHEFKVTSRYEAHISEADFLKTSISKNLVGLTLYPQVETLSPDSHIRLYAVTSKAGVK